MGDVVKLKKPHPCGANEWEIVRVGADIGLKCRGCERRVMLVRSEFDRRFRGFIGSTKVGFSLQSLMIRIFASSEQRLRLAGHVLPPVEMAAGYRLRATHPDDLRDCQRIADLLNAA
ncbi:MAG: DUF951 domain-containing protein, partial [Coriobacteriia bacterium]|nr:DUF951 domain-containing protein [Coriobacteriia bacterium]